MTGRKLKLLGEDRREQQQYIDSGAETLTSAAGYFSGRIQELGEKVERTHVRAALRGYFWGLPRAAQPHSRLLVTHTYRPPGATNAATEHAN